MSLIYFFSALAIFAFSPPANAQPRALPMCRIEVTREGGGQNNQQEFGVSTKPSLIARDRNQSSQAKTVSSLVVSSGREASIEVDGEAVFVKCYALRGGFELDLSVASYGTHPSQGTKRFTTSISVQKGQKTEIGGLVRNLKDKNRVISTSGIVFQKSATASYENVYLLLQ